MDIITVSVLMCWLAFGSLGCSSEVSHDAMHVLCCVCACHFKIPMSEPGSSFVYACLSLFAILPLSLALPHPFLGIFFSLPPFPSSSHFFLSVLFFFFSYSHSCFSPISPGTRLGGTSCIDPILGMGGISLLSL